MNGLAFVLIIFAGIIIQCKGFPNTYTEQNDLYGIIIGRSIPNKVKNSMQLTEKSIKLSLVTGPLNSYDKDYELICPAPEDSEMIKTDGHSVYTFNSSVEIEYFIDMVVHRIKKLEINYHAGMSSELRYAISIILNNRAEHLKELHISCEGSDDEVWNLLLNGKGQIISFKNVEEFQFNGDFNRNKFNIPKIFPKLKDFKLFGTIKNASHLDPLKKLKQLMLFTDSLTHEQLASIVLRNQDLTMFGVSAKEKQTMELIANHLMNVQIFRLEICHSKALIPPKKAVNSTHTFLNVKFFLVSFHGMKGRVKSIPFHMPSLEMLVLDGEQFGDNTIAFIDHFKGNEHLEYIIIEKMDEKNLGEVRKHLEESAWTLLHDLVDKYFWFRRQAALSPQTI